MPGSDGGGRRRLRAVATVLFAANVVFMIAVTQFFFLDDHPPTNLVPFRGIVRDCTSGNARDFVVNFLGNILTFVPFGFLYPIALGDAPGRGRGAFAFCAGFSLAIEVAQYLSGRRTADVDDFLLNVLGGMIGYAAYRLAARLFRRRQPSGSSATTIE